MMNTITFPDQTVNSNNATDTQNKTNVCQSQDNVFSSTTITFLSATDKKKKRGKSKSDHITLEDLAPYFVLPMSEACIKLGMSGSLLKKICRKLGLARWPFRKMRSLKKKLAAVEDPSGEKLPPEVLEETEKHSLELQLKFITKSPSNSSSEDGGPSPSSPTSQSGGYATHNIKGKGNAKSFWTFEAYNPEPTWQCIPPAHPSHSKTRAKASNNAFVSTHTVHDQCFQQQQQQQQQPQPQPQPQQQQQGNHNVPPEWFAARKSNNNIDCAIIGQQREGHNTSGSNYNVHPGKSDGVCPTQTTMRVAEGGCHSTPPTPDISMKCQPSSTNGHGGFSSFPVIKSNIIKTNSIIVKNEWHTTTQATSKIVPSNPKTGAVNFTEAESINPHTTDNQAISSVFTTPMISTCPQGDVVINAFQNTDFAEFVFRVEDLTYLQVNKHSQPRYNNGVIHSVACSMDTNCSHSPSKGSWNVDMDSNYLLQPLNPDDFL